MAKKKTTTKKTSSGESTEQLTKDAIATIDKNLPALGRVVPPEPIVPAVTGLAVAQRDDRLVVPGTQSIRGGLPLAPGHRGASLRRCAV